MFVTDGPGLLTAFKAIAILRNEKLQSIPTASCHPRLVTEVHPRSRKTKPALAYGLELRPQYISLTERQSLLSCNKDY